jgi:hypothetical protein
MPGMLVARTGLSRVMQWHTSTGGATDHDAAVAAHIASEALREQVCLLLQAKPMLPSVVYPLRYTGKFEPERLGDLLPALLPEHPNVLSPVAWWSGLPSASQLTAPAPATPQQQQAQAGSSTPAGAAGFRLYTVWPRYERSLREHMDALAAQAGGSAAPDEPLMDARSILKVVADVAAGLQHLHAHGVQHCDVKPEVSTAGHGTRQGQQQSMLKLIPICQQPAILRSWL